MRLSFVFLSLVAPASAFVPSPLCATRLWTGVASSILSEAPDSLTEEGVDPIKELLKSSAINERLEAQIQKMMEKDKTSKVLTKDDLKIVFEDEHVVVVDKPAGVLCVPGKGGGGSLSQVVYDTIGCEMDSMDKMVVHRLGMDTSGLVVFAKTIAGMRGMNSLFRSREVSRKYEALVCGHMAKDYGVINMPLMRCLLHPPFMRVSTNMAQCAIASLDLTKNDIGKKYLEMPKESLTEYKVIAREELGGQPVTRVELSSISGRTHQLNVHLAAFGHPIVGDTTYGVDGETEPNGGLSDEELALFPQNPNRVSEDIERAVMKAAKGRGMLVHAKSIAFRHPTDTRIGVSLSSDAPF